MTDKQDQTAKQAYDAEAARQLGAELGMALEGAGKALKAWGADLKANSETAALAGLYRRLRALDATHPTMSTEARHAAQDEIRARLGAALAGYDVAFLADLATFGGWLADAAGKEWRKR